MTLPLGSIDGITFRKGRREISPQDVFNSFYGGLERLISYNRKHDDNVAHERRHVSQHDPDREKELFRDWRDSIPKDITAKITKEDGGKETLHMQPRHNIETTFSEEPELRSKRLRKPNILFLENEDGSEDFILRKATTYKPESYPFSRYNKEAVGNKHDNFAYKAFLPDDADAYNHGKKGGMLFIPEPFLISGLERAMETYDLPRITPKHEHVLTDGQDNTSYVLRPYLNSVRSRSTDEEKFTDYLATMHTLGLIDSYDRQANHYCREKRERSPVPSPVVNIDPDFITHVGSVEQQLSHDVRSFFEQAKQVHQTILDDDYNSFKDSYKDKRDDRRKEFRNELVPRRIQAVETSYDKQLLR